MAISFRGYFLAALSVASIAVRSFTERISSAIAGVLVAIVDALSDPGWRAYLRDDFALAPPGGIAIPRALQEDMRHEAGVSRRSAARHI